MAIESRMIWPFIYAKWLNCEMYSNYIELFDISLNDIHFLNFLIGDFYQILGLCIIVGTTIRKLNSGFSLYMIPIGSF